MILIGLFLIPVLVGGFFFYYFRNTVTWKEFILMEVIALAFAGGGWALARWGALQDVEHWNGRITKKNQGTTFCCHCRSVCTGSGKNQTCTTECDHIFDHYWSVSVSTGDEITIETCQGWKSEPKAWTKAKVGEPASVAHTYKNYLKADKHTLFRKGDHEKWLNHVPAFPKIHNFYKVKKAIGHKLKVPPGWEKGLRDLNADIGRKKQVDITVLMTKVDDPLYADAVETKWLFGPKNAIIVVIGAPDGKTIKWVRAVSISKIEELKIDIRDGLRGKDLTDAEGNVAFLRNLITKKFHRTPMEEFSYLAVAVQPSKLWTIVLYVLTFIATVALGIYAHQKDIFGDEWKLRRRNRRY